MAPEQRRDRTGDRTDDQVRAKVEWERGSGGIEPRGDAAVRPRAPRVSVPSPSDEESGRDRGESTRGGENDAPARGSRHPGQFGSSERTSGSERRYGAASRDRSGERDSDERGEDRDARRGPGGGSDRSERSGRTPDPGERARGPGGESTRSRVGRPGNRRSPVGDTDTGSPQSGSQRGSHRETGVAGRVGGQFGEDRSGESGGRPDRDEPDQFGGRRGGDERDRRYGSRRGHGTQRRDRRTE